MTCFILPFRRIVFWFEDRLFDIELVFERSELIHRIKSFNQHARGFMGRRKEKKMIEVEVEIDEPDHQFILTEKFEPNHSVVTAVKELEEAYKEACQDAQVGCKRRLKEAVNTLISLVKE